MEKPVGTEKDKFNATRTKQFVWFEEELRKLKLFKEIACEIVDKFKENIDVQTLLNLKNDELHRRLLELELEEQPVLWQQKEKPELEGCKLETERNLRQDLHNLCCILGFSLSIEHLEDDSQLLTVYYDQCYVRFTMVQGFQELVELCPQHPNFLEIQRFLKNTQDLKGLLGTLQKFFSDRLTYTPDQDD